MRLSHILSKVVRARNAIHRASNLMRVHGKSTPVEQAITSVNDEIQNLGMFEVIAREGIEDTITSLVEAIEDLEKTVEDTMI